MRSDKLHPEARRLLDAMDAQGVPPVESMPIEAARQMAREATKQICPEPIPLARVEDLTIPGPGGRIPIRIYAAEQGGSRPCLVYLHGGGYVLCDLETHDPVCRALAQLSGAIVVSVDYRLAPEHKFPAALEDCHAATLWVCANTAGLGVDPRRIAVGGDSAGANMATVIAIRCRDAGGPPLALQLLVYPPTNLGSFDTPSHQEFAEGHYLTRAAMDYFLGLYFARPEDAQTPDASPALVQDLRGLPPALVLTAECDPLCDEGEAYAARLQQAGVAVTRSRYAGMFHPFFSMPILSETHRAYQQVAAALRNMQPAIAGQSQTAVSSD